MWKIAISTHQGREGRTELDHPAEPGHEDQPRAPRAPAHRQGKRAFHQ